MRSIVNTMFIAAVFTVILVTQPLAYAAKKVSPETVDGATTVSTEEAKKLFDQGITFIDVRSNRDWEAGRIPGAIHIELKHEFNEESLGAVVAKNQAVVIYCNSIGCMRSSHASQKAVAWGYTKIYYYRLGFPDWKRAGYAIQ
jgi:rhodanese-related sulfurtransferase